MCGIAGFYNPAGLDASSSMALLGAMTNRIAHRGPDDAGAWIDAQAGIALGHRRLSVLDLSPAGHQPMISPGGRYLITFNGEIYNHEQLRTELSSESIAWRGHSDTETLLASFERWGVDATLKKLVGMFAFALWDRQERLLTLARDRLGEKPLYYGWQGDAFFFVSELKALRAHPAVRAEIDRGALKLYMRHGYIPAPHSIYKGVYKLLPGTYLQLSAEQTRRAMAKQIPYWSLLEAVKTGIAEPFEGSDYEAINELEARITRAVSLQRRADVPVGVFLSGGIDSSTVVALLQAVSSRPVNTFTIGFLDKRYNEAHYAAIVAKHLGTNHVELYASPQDALNLVPKLPELYDEPFGDASAIPTLLVSRLAREHVTVALTGDGGDELFAGYARYQVANRIWRLIDRTPSFGRRLLATGLRELTGDWLDHLLRPFFSSSSGAQPPKDKADALAMLLSAENMEAFYRIFVSQWRHPDSILGAEPEPLIPLTNEVRSLVNGCAYQSMMYADTKTYLADDILTKVDRAAMAVSLETRIPMLDHRIVEFAWRLPTRMKIRGRQSKWLLRQVLYKYVPKQLIERTKQGFTPPVDEWIRGPLRDWAEALLAERRLENDGLFRPEPIRKKWTEHLAGRYSWRDPLWAALSAQAWIEAQRRH